MNSLFRVSERHHSGLILMTELAAAYAKEGCFVSLTEIGERMRLSSGYLEEIALRLREAGLIEGRKGPGGGYRLTQAPESIPVGAIIEAIEGPLAFVECQAGAACPVESACKSKTLWNFLHSSVTKTLKETSLASIANG